MKKIMMIALIISLGICIDVTLNGWKKGIIIKHNTIRFLGDPVCVDNEVSVDVGVSICYPALPHPVEGFNVTVLEITNAYPGYEVKCDFKLKNIGQPTDTIEDIIIIDPTN